MKKGFSYKREKCPVCDGELSENWIVRHLKAEHATSDLIGYCNLALDEVCAENCVECQNWDFCEYVTATVIPDLLKRLSRHLVVSSHTFEQAERLEDLHDVTMSVIARLRGKHYISANDEVPL